MSIFETILQRLDDIEEHFVAMPEWIPITKEFARQNGYKTVDGLRIWCQKHLPPDQFDKRENRWCVNKTAVRLIKNKIALM